MNPIYTFTQDELRVVANAKARYLRTLEVIAELHNLGPVQVVADASGQEIGLASPAIPQTNPKD